MAVQKQHGSDPYLYRVTFNALAQLIHYIIFYSFSENKLQSLRFLLLMMFLYISLKFWENTTENITQFSIIFPQL